MRAVQLALIATSVVLLAVLAMHPDTAWLLRMQFRLLYSPREMEAAFKEYQPAGKTPPAWLRYRLEEVARDHPDDYLVQLAWAIEQRAPSDVNLRDLLPHFGNRPALLAHILRYDVMKRVRIRRLEEWMLYPPSKRPSPQSLVPPSPEDLAAYDEIASKGERLDPDNVYFPLMRAIGLLAAHRDNEAIAAIERASQKSRWEDYTREEAEARLHLLETAFGRQPTISQFLNAYVVVEPHWVAIRAMARTVVFFASEKERRQEYRDAMNLRMAMLRCASRIRSQSRSGVGVLVAVAVGAISIASPGEPGHPSETAQQRIVRQRQRFVATLRRLGRDTDANWAQDEFAAMDEASAILRAGTAPDMWFRMPLRAVRAWTLNMFLLFALLGIVLLWLVYAVNPLKVLRRGITPYVVLSATLLGTGILILFSPWADLPARAVATLASMSDLAGNPPRLTLIPPPIFRLITAFAVVLLLLMMVTAAGIYGLVRGREPNDALAGSIRHGGLTSAAVLLLLYLLSLLHTAQVERNWAQHLQALRIHEGKYHAKQLDKTWPP